MAEGEALGSAEVWALGAPVGAATEAPGAEVADDVDEADSLHVPRSQVYPIGQHWSPHAGSWAVRFVVWIPLLGTKVAF